MKIFFTYEQQVEHLKKKGFIISDPDSVIEILRKENYYNVINAYLELFIDKKQSKINKYDTVKKNARIEEIITVYKLDIFLRNLFLKNILILENNIRTAIAHEFSKAHGIYHDEYLIIDNFYYKNDNEQKQLEDLISSIKNEINHKTMREKDNIVKHYLNKHEHIPLWVLINIFTFGNLSKFYYFLKTEEKKDIARYFDLNAPNFKSFMSILSLYRNICAHSERFFCEKVHKNINIQNTKIETYYKDFNIQKESNGNYEQGLNDVFSLIMIFKLMLPSNNFKIFTETLVSYFDDINKCLITITIKDIQKKMGFPENWKEIINS